MFSHNLKYSLKILFRNKMLIFWTFAFPIILGTFFFMAFSNIENNEKLDIIDIAIVENNNFKDYDIYKETFEKLSSKNDKEQLFNISYVTDKEARMLLSEDKISGYITFEAEPKVIIMSNGINQTILNYVTEEISQSIQLIATISKEQVDKELKNGNYNINYEKIYKDIYNIVQDEKVYIDDISDNNLSYTMIEYYTLIAMTCLYGGTLGMVSINQNLANMSNKGKRIAIGPTSKKKVILSSIISSYLTQLIGLSLLFLYTIFILKVDYGSNLVLVILLALVGALAGLSLGVFVATVIKGNENIKLGIILSVTMLGCFLSGMMGITMKYIVDKNVPIINKINPASMITDGFYSLYYYDTLNRYYFNIASLFIFAFILILISCMSLRRQKYDSI